MNLGFYYHIPIRCTSEGITAPGYLGVFLDSLASQVHELILFMHDVTLDFVETCDYKLQNKNIVFVSLGTKTPSWDRFLFPNRTLRKIDRIVCTCDFILVRGPSPLAPQFFNRFKYKTTICYFLVGDYKEGSKYLRQPWWRIIPIRMLLYRNDWQLKKVFSKCLIFVNSLSLFEKYQKLAKRIIVIRTTTLCENDFYSREDTCLNQSIKLLYTGRIDLAKGLIELVKATANLVKQKIDISLHIAGIEEKNERPIEMLLKNVTKELQIEERVTFHGPKPIGEELNKIYRMADIYIIPSYHEGFPRTIWEAMANGLPVIATKVGSIPYYLRDGEDALLIEPKKVVQIQEAVIMLINDYKLRRRLISNGALLAKENTVETSVQLLISHLRSNQL